MDKKKATNYFEMHRYSQAYESAVGTNMKEKNPEQYKKIVTVMKVQHALDSYQNYENVKKYPEALDALLKAKEIHFFGVGDAFAVCQLAYMKFGRLGIPCSVHSDVMLQMMTAGNLTSEDVALAVSYEGRSRNVVEAMKIAKERGAVTISITKMNKSPLLRYTDISLFTAVNDLTVGRDKVTRRVSDQFILDALYLGYTTKINKGYKKQLQKIQTVIDCNKI